MWLFLALTGHLLNAFVFITDKAFVQKIFPNPRALSFVAGAVGIFTFALWPWFLKSAPPFVIGAAIASGAVSIIGLIYFFTALSRDEVSRVVPAIGSVTPLFTFGLSYFLLDERLQGKFLFAFIVLAIGGILIAFRSYDDVFRRRSYSLFSLEIFVGFLFALSFVLQKYAFNATDNFSAFLWSRIGASAAALPLLLDPLVRRKLLMSEIRQSGAGRGVLYVLSRIFAGISPLVIVVAISFGSATLINSLQGIQYVFLFVLAVLFSKKWPEIFREEVDRYVLIQKITATMLIGVGLALLV